MQVNAPPSTSTMPPKVRRRVMGASRSARKAATVCRRVRKMTLGGAGRETEGDGEGSVNRHTVIGGLRESCGRGDKVMSHISGR